MAGDTLAETGTQSNPSVAEPHPGRRVAVALAGALTLMLTFVALFLAAFHDPEPNRVPVAVVGSLDAARQLQVRVARAGPGSINAIAVATPDDARSAVLRQRVQAALVMDPEHPRLIVASAAGTTEMAALKDLVGRAAGPGAAPLVVEDVRPLPRGDSKGLSPVFVAFGVTLASLGSGIVLSVFGRRLRYGLLLTALLGLGVVAGLLIAVLADPLIGALTGAFWPLAGLIALLVVAVAAPMCGLGRLAGPHGLVLGVFVMLLLAVSSGGGPLGFYMLPEFFRAISQWLPTGTAMTAIRRAVYFDGERTLHSVVVLAVWAAGGLLAVAVGRLRIHRVPIGPSRHSSERNLPLGLSS
jgi:hypothetical protein